MENQRRRALLQTGLLAGVAGVALRPVTAATATLDPWIDVRQFGATGNGVTDDTVALQAALNSVPAGGGTVFIPAGTYRLTSVLTAGNRHLRVLGAGRGSTSIRSESAVGGLDFDFNSVDQRLTVESISLLTAATGGGVALKARWPAFAGGPTACPHLFDIHVGPADPVHDYWTKGIELTNATGAVISAFYIQGANNSFSMSHGIHLLGTSTISNIHVGYVFYADRGVLIDGQSEGAYISDIEVVFAKVGIQLNSSSPGSAISNCHVNSTEQGIYLFNHTETAITGNLLYRLSDQNWMGIYAVHAPFCRIVGNEIATIPLAGNRNGIVLHGATYDCTVEGNVIRDMDTGIWLIGGGSDGNIVIGNRIRNPSHAAILNWGSTNLIVDNL